MWNVCRDGCKGGDGVEKEDQWRWRGEGKSVGAMGREPVPREWEDHMGAGQEERGGVGVSEGKESRGAWRER